MILLDTHALIWYSTGDASLGASARESIEQSLADKELAVSAISFWETAMLVDKGRIELDLAVSGWRRDLLISGLREIPIDGDIGIEAAELDGFHGDPADRLITATTILAGATLITADRRILEWAGTCRRLDARL